MTTDEILRFDEDGVLIGDRIASSGWPLRDGLRIVKANDPEAISRAEEVAIRLGRIDEAKRFLRPGAELDQALEYLESWSIAVTGNVLGEDYLAATGLIVGHVEPRRAVLDAFLRLAPDPTDAAILDYASHYGMLGLYLLDYLTAREPDGLFRSPDQFGDQFPSASGYRPAPGILVEPLRLWRQVIGDLDAASTIAGHLRRDRPAPLDPWTWLARPVDLWTWLEDVIGLAPDWPWPGRDLRPFTDVASQRQALAHVLNEWLAFGAVRPVFIWGTYKQAEPMAPLGATTLFGGLVLQLLLAAGGQVGFAICSECATAYVPHRRPPTGAYGASRANYCPTCRQRGRPQRAAARHYRDRRARLRATTQEGS